MRVRLGVEYEPRLRVTVEAPFEELGWLFDARIWSVETLDDLLRVASEVRAGARPPYETYSDGARFTIHADALVVEDLYDDRVTRIPLDVFERLVRRLQRFLANREETADELLDDT